MRASLLEEGDHVLENVKRFYTGHDRWEQLSAALAFSSSSALLLRAALLVVGPPYPLGIAAALLSLLCFILVFAAAFCLLGILRLSARLGAAERVLIAAEVVICIAIMHVI